MTDLEQKIETLKEEIAKLPGGYISRKKIRGAVKLYYQWNEDGKKKSKYVNDEAAEVLQVEIERRRELQKELKRLKAYELKGETLWKPNWEPYVTDLLLDETLWNFSKGAVGFRKRECFGKLRDFLDMEYTEKVFILFGLRRTGKTTLIKQSIQMLGLEKISQTAFIQVRANNTMADLNHDLKLLAERKYKYVFIDEVTLLKDFIEGAALFSDIFAAIGMKIILSGTDSLGFLFSEDEQLYDRCELLHTTFIPYREFANVLGIEGIDEYIRYGGTMSISGANYNLESTFATKASADAYVDTAIAKNIQHSLRCYQYEGHFRSLQELYEKNELTSAINRVVEDINHRFTVDVLTRKFISHDLGISANNLRKDRENPTDILDKIDKEQLTESLREVLEIRDKEEQTIEIRDEHRTEIKEYLDLLDLTVDISSEHLPVSNVREVQTVIAQPGLRYAQAKALIEQLMKDEKIQHLSANERKLITERILDEIRGRMMEEIILLETKKAMPDKQVFRLKFAIGEFDMVVYDPEEVSCKIYEIKHSKQRTAQQYRHLLDDKKCRDTEFRYGRITEKSVIYRGESAKEGPIQYVNAEDYLLGLEMRES